MKSKISQKLISAHLISGEMIPGTEIGLKIDQVLLQDATGTLVMLVRSFSTKKAKPEIAVQRRSLAPNGL
jgi:aconitate hydratase